MTFEKSVAILLLCMRGEETREEDNFLMFLERMNRDMGVFLRVEGGTGGFSQEKITRDTEIRLEYPIFLFALIQT